MFRAGGAHGEGLSPIGLELHVDSQHLSELRAQGCRVLGFKVSVFKGLGVEGFKV